MKDLVALVAQLEARIVKLEEHAAYGVCDELRRKREFDLGEQKRIELAQRAATDKDKLFAKLPIRPWAKLTVKGSQRFTHGKRYAPNRDGIMSEYAGYGLDLSGTSNVLCSDLIEYRDDQFDINVADGTYAIVACSPAECLAIEREIFDRIGANNAMGRPAR